MRKGKRAKGNQPKQQSRLEKELDKSIQTSKNADGFEENKDGIKIKIELDNIEEKKSHIKKSGRKKKKQEKKRRENKTQEVEKKVEEKENIQLKEPEEKLETKQKEIVVDKSETRKEEIELGPKREKKKSKSKRTRRNNIMIRLIQIILLSIMIYSGLEILKWNNDNTQTKEIIEEIATTVTEVKDEQGKIIEYHIDFNSLKEKNNDVIAWIKVNNTSVQFPVVKTKNNEFYLTHSLDKSYNKAGWIFADYRNNLDGNDKNIIVYGHNRMDGSMFSTLENTLEKDWYQNEENRKIVFITENDNSIYEIFSIYEIDDEDYYIQTDFRSDKAYESFLNTLKSRSIYNFEVELGTEDHILTLSTCTNRNNSRIVVHAKKINESANLEELDKNEDAPVESEEIIVEENNEENIEETAN